MEPECQLVGAQSLNERADESIQASGLNLAIDGGLLRRKSVRRMASTRRAVGYAKDEVSTVAGCGGQQKRGSNGAMR